MEGFLIRGWEPILPGVRSAGGSGVSTPCGAVSTRGYFFPSPGSRSCRCMEGFLNRGWGLIFPGCGGIVRFLRGATPVARASPPDWPKTGGGRPSANGIGARKTLG